MAKGKHESVDWKGIELEIDSLELGGTAVTATAAELNALASTGLDSTELGYLNGVTAGTVTASKAVVVDGSKDVSVLRTVGVTNLDAGASGTAGTVDVFPTTASKGKLALAAVDNDGDTATTISNAAMGQASVVSIPDPGAATANFMLTDAGNDGELVTATAKELNQFNDLSRFRVFDDFLDAAIDTTNNWIVFAGSEAAATAAVTVTSPEGEVMMGGGGVANANSGSVMSLILLAKGALVSDGRIVFETRLEYDDRSGANICIGLSDTLATDDEHGLYTASATTVSDGGLTISNAACFLADSDATETTNWIVVSENAGTISNGGTVTTGDTPTAIAAADTYQTLRIEVDPDGDARYYVNGTLMHSETTAVATAARLIPFISVDEAGGSPAAIDLTIDYVLFEGSRASGG